MSTDITIYNLLPDTATKQDNRLQVSTKSYIGIDFGTSSTVVSIAYFDKNTKDIITDIIWLRQMQEDGVPESAKIIPTVIAWHNGNILVGSGAAKLKYFLKKDENIWFSFKMELGEDYGVKYTKSELANHPQFKILNPKDAATIFFKYLKAQITKYLESKQLSNNVEYAISIPASFEANQRQDLIDALSANGMMLNKQSLIDEPNAAFLSYVHKSANVEKPLVLPDWETPNLLVFDFGAGTCDISILQLGKNSKGFYSKNLAISKFEKLGGDNIDRLIAINYLLPTLLENNGKSLDDFREKEKKIIINRLLKYAEQLKTLICDIIAKKMDSRMLPAQASSTDAVTLGESINIDTKKGRLTLDRPSLSYDQFHAVMNIFLKQNTLVPFKNKIIDEDFATIFSPINTALKKANLDKEDIDYVLLIGGSSKNPYIQSALQNYFKESDLLLPRDLQEHVSLGAALHSLIYNGFGKNIVQPIISEPIIMITRDIEPKILFSAGTEIPSVKFTIDDLVTNRDNQESIELPICLGSVDKLLYNLKINSNNDKGFPKNTRISLELQITADKLLHAKATALGETVSIEPLNPFANKELTAEERLVLAAEKAFNIAAAKSGGIPLKDTYYNLINNYEKYHQYQKAAELLEEMSESYPSAVNYNRIGLNYSSAGLENKALENYEKAYIHNRNATTAFNYAHTLKSKDKEKAKEVFRDSLSMQADIPHSLFELGKILNREGNEEGKVMVEKAFEVWKEEFDNNTMEGNDFGWFASVAEYLGKRDFGAKIRTAIPTEKGEQLYDFNNLTVTYTETGLTKQ